MKVLQIANDYLNPLFKKMFDAISDAGIDNKVAVPISYNGIEKSSWKDEVVVLKCFSYFDRFFFYRKQKKIITSIEEGLLLNEYDLIHAHTLFSNGYAAMKLAKKYNKKYIVAIRNTDVNTFFRFWPHLRETGIKIMENAAAIVFLSPAYKEYVISKYVPLNKRAIIENKTYVVPNGVSRVFLENKGKEKNYIETKELKLLYVGEITANKNIKRIIDTARLRNKMSKKTRVIVIGNLVDRKCDYILGDSLVEYHSKCTQEELINYYRMADVFVMPSHTETFGLVYVEAMSQGLPIIYTKGQGFDQYFKDGIVGYSVNDYSVEDINKKIEMILKNYAKISRNCIDFSDEFDWNKIAKNYVKIYNDLVHK